MLVVFSPPVNNACNMDPGAPTNGVAAAVWPKFRRAAVGVAAAVGVGATVVGAGGATGTGVAAENSAAESSAPALVFTTLGVESAAKVGAALGVAAPTVVVAAAAALGVAMPTTL